MINGLGCLIMIHTVINVGSVFSYAYFFLVLYIGNSLLQLLWFQFLNFRLNDLLQLLLLACCLLLLLLLGSCLLLLLLGFCLLLLLLLLLFEPTTAATTWTCCYFSTFLPSPNAAWSCCCSLLWNSSNYKNWSYFIAATLIRCIQQ